MHIFKRTIHIKNFYGYNFITLKYELENHIINNDDFLGRGYYGTVLNLNNKYAIKIIENKPSFDRENTNMQIVGRLTNIYPFFPKYYGGFEFMHFNKKKYCIVEEKLENIDKIIDKNNNFIIDKENQDIFFKQLYYLYYSKYQLFNRYNLCVIHNDFKPNNLLLRPLNNEIKNFISNTFINSKYKLELINNKYLLVFCDFGESYVNDFKGIITKEKTQFKKDDLSLLRFRFAKTCEISIQEVDKNINSDDINVLLSMVDKTLQHNIIYDYNKIYNYDEANNIFGSLQNKYILLDHNKKFQMQYCNIDKLII